jgi:hypothetical protein
MKKWAYLVPILLLISCEVTEGPRPARRSGFTPPKDNRITEEKARSYINASRYLLEAIANHEKSIEEFIKKYNLSRDLSELADSTYGEAHQDVVKAWDELVKDWGNSEKEAYRKAGVTEEEFNWIGGALTDSINKDIQEKIAKALGGEGS